MSRTSTPVASGPVTAEGTLLSDVYGRLVTWHHTMATADAITRDMQITMMRDMMDALKEIGANPQFRAADAAEQAAFDRQRQATPGGHPGTGSVIDA